MEVTLVVCLFLNKAGLSDGRIFKRMLTDFMKELNDFMIPRND